jgi:hypothetical protein
MTNKEKSEDQLESMTANQEDRAPRSPESDGASISQEEDDVNPYPVSFP